MSEDTASFVFGITLIILMIVVVFAGITLTERTSPLTGKITKLWTQGTFYRYAVVETSDGKRQSVDVAAKDFPLLDIGETCTFQVKSNGEAKSVACEASR